MQIRLYYKFPVVYGICIEYTVFTSPYIVFTEVRNPSNNLPAARKHWPMVSGWTPVLSTKPSSKEMLRRVWSATEAIIVRINNQNNICINFICGSIFLTKKNTLSLATLGSIFLLWTSFVWCQKLLYHCRRAESIFSKIWLWLWCFFLSFFLSLSHLIWSDTMWSYLIILPYHIAPYLIISYHLILSYLILSR